jgi:hypothetical protein
MRPEATCTDRAINVAGGQIRTSADGGLAVTNAAMASISRSCALSPFIFQFPAINGRTLSHLCAQKWSIPQRRDCVERGNPYRRG